MVSSVGSNQIPLRFAAQGAASFEDFVIGPNAVAVAAVRAAASHANESWPLLWGARGRGKTHLLSAATSLAATAGRRVAFLAAEVLLSHTPEVLDSLTEMDLVCLDDLDQLLGDPRWELALFNLFNRLREQGAVLLAAAGCQPRSLSVGLPDLRSRLNWGNTLELKPLSDDNKIELLQRRAISRGSPVDVEVVRYLISRKQRGVSDLVGALDQLIDIGFAEKRRITIPLARTHLGNSQLAGSHMKP